MAEDEQGEKSGILSGLLHKDGGQGGSVFFDYRVIILLIFILLVVIQAFVPSLISHVPIIGPYMAAVAHLYAIGAGIIAGNSGIFTMANFMVTFSLVFFPPFLLYVAFFTFRTVKGVGKYLFPVLAILAVGYILLMLI
ncbi:MAG: hypothetical protein ABH829_04865 [archaeon]